LINCQKTAGALCEPAFFVRKGNCSAGLRIYSADREKVIRESKNPIAAGDFKWIFERNGEGAEQLPEQIL